MVEHVTDAEADAYFASRPRNSRLGAWASPQSRPLMNRVILEERLAEMEKPLPGRVPRPDYWSGYRVVPEMFEFWQEMPYRLHDRTVYRRSPGGGVGANQTLPVALMSAVRACNGKRKPALLLSAGPKGRS